MKITSDEIKVNLGNPEILERMYRESRKVFKTEFDKIYHEIENTEAARFWSARLEYDNGPEMLRALTVREGLTVAAVCLMVAFLIKMPALFEFGFSETVFYEKNAALIVFSGLALYTMIIKRISDPRRIVMTAIFFLVPAVYVNLLPADEPGDAVLLAYLHLPLLMWFIYGLVYTNFEFRELKSRMNFIRSNGDLAIIYALIAIAGGMLTAVTIGLFDAIGLNIEKFYADYIVISGAAAAPVVAAFIIEKYPALAGRIAPIIAGIFSPLLLVTLLIFLTAIAVTGKDPYNDRDFLLVFNLMLLGVVVIIIFSVSETSFIKNRKLNGMVLFFLSIVAILTDLIALSAIFYRLGEYGLTANRLAVLGSNILILINLVLIMTALFRVNFRGKEFSTVEPAVTGYLPVYMAWTIFVIFGFPLIFGIH